MKEPEESLGELGARTPPLAARRDIFIDPSVFHAARIFMILSIICFGILMVLIFLPLLTLIFMDKQIYSPLLNDTNNAQLLAFAPHALLFIAGIVTAIIAYRLFIASGVKSQVIIPDQDYDLLAPLVAEGKSEAIDQYVRLSSLSGFTGTFTKLGLTGLPLATIALTLIFSILALLRFTEFFDLVKLTLGAFIGSFVQRQVESRSSQRQDESKPISK